MQCIKEDIGKFDVNVIVVVWTEGENDYYYTRVVGAVTANMIKLLQMSSGLTLNNVHLVGHSLGAHVAGYVGEIIKGVGRITGLDPAGPAFYIANGKVRLDSSDATFVDVIHTDLVAIEPIYSCAHMKAIYYFIESVNPDCKFSSQLCQNWKNFKDGNGENGGSGHKEMGYNLAYDAYGKYYLRTGRKYPYCDNGQ
ncbi:lipase member H-like [Mytilus californianus]|uniref:lipase member H-like n=1 Tax=Mytilus californianus TaxID=6549 RepID=UPI0022453D92|nr:lipase member H-like [Mytilus californianus]